MRFVFLIPILIFAFTPINVPTFLFPSETQENRLETEFSNHLEINNDEGVGSISHPGLTSVGNPLACDPVASVSAAPNPLCPGNTTILTAIGAEPGATITWFDNLTGGQQVGTGNPFTSLPLNNTSTFCAEQNYSTQVDTTYEYTGGVQTFTVPAGILSIDIQAFGAEGSDQFTSINVGGKGGQASGSLTVVPGQILQILVGGNGTIHAGGFNGGGDGGFAANTNNLEPGGGGGGASDVRIGAGTLADRVIVAGGGGGFGSEGGSLPNAGGHGGGLSGGDGGTMVGSGGFGTGGTQVMGGLAGIGSLGADGFMGTWGIGGNGGTTSQTQPCGGGGGGGYFGGGGGGAFLATGGGGGGGGSSHIGGVIGGTTTIGSQPGNGKDGKVIISYIEQCISPRICITVTIDDVSPSIICPQNLLVPCSEDVPIPDLQTVTATDNSGITPIISFVSDIIANQICDNQFTLIRTYQAFDTCGNSNTCQQIITVSDTIPPTIICPSDLKVPCASQVPPANIASVVSSDNCINIPTITFVGDVISNQNCINDFEIVRTYQSTDACGNSATCTQIITVSDTVAPTIVCPPNLVVPCASQVPPANITSVVSSDNCINIPTITFVGDVISNQICINGFEITRTYQSTDACGNSATCTQIITISDTIAPTIFCPPDIVVPCASLVPIPDIANVLSSDDCGVNPTIIFIGDSISNQTCLNGFMITRTYQATNLCGNVATCSQVITVLDDIPPVITFTDPLIVNLNSGETLHLVCNGQIQNCALTGLNENSVTVKDNCDLTQAVFLTSVLIDTGDCRVDNYTHKYQLTWTAVDSCGNSSAAFIYIKVMDTDIECFDGIYIPNVFSPNDDGNNDDFRPFINAQITDYQFVIFNRWGDLVFESSLYGESWNGEFNNQSSSQGVYAYKLTFKLSNGKSKLYTGTVTIVR